MWKDVGKEARKEFPISAAEVKNLIDGGEEMDVGPSPQQGQPAARPSYYSDGGSDGPAGAGT